MSSRERIPLESSETRLSIAVRLIDTFTQQHPRRPPRVRLKDRPERFRRTASGYLVLTDLPDSVSEVTVVADDSPRHLRTAHVVDTLATDIDDDSSYVAEELEIAPAPAYPFPAGTTLVRGTISEGEKRVSGAELEIDLEGISDDDRPGFRAEGWSDARGEYVLYFQNITTDDVTDEYESGETSNGELKSRHIHVGGQPPTVTAKHPDSGVKTSTSIPIPEGTTTSLDLSF